MPVGIVDLFFYEELSRVAGHETGSQWLLSKCTKPGCSRRGTSSTGGSSTPSLSRTPDQSAPASPRGQHQLCIESKAPAGHRVGFFSSNHESSHTSSFSSIMRLGDVDLTTVQATMLAASKLSPSSSFKSDSSMIGLIFTDAAHSVLD
jgi:hypothetical protein